MMDVVEFQSGRDLLLDHHNKPHFSSEMKKYSDSDYKRSWGIPEAETKGFAGTESVENVSSSESTEEDDDYISELTRHITRYMLQDEDKHALATSFTAATTASSEKTQESSWGCVGWPSDVTTTMWSPPSSVRSSEGASQEPSPPVTPIKDDRKTMSYAAVVRKLAKLSNEGPNNKQGNKGISNSTTTTTENQKVQKQGPVAFDQSQDSLISQNPKEEQHSKKEGSTNRGRESKKIGHQKCESYNQSNKKFVSSAHIGLRPPPVIANLPSNSWMNYQQVGSGMRAVFLGGSGLRAGVPSNGTGVFLPCVIGNTSQSSMNKRGCAPVLIPAKVVQALKVHFDRVVGDQPRANPTPLAMPNDALNGGRRTMTHSSKKRQSRATATVLPDMNTNEIGLPQEWTY